jgi:hypothetical protein
LLDRHRNTGPSKRNRRQQPEKLRSRVFNRYGPSLTSALIFRQQRINDAVYIYSLRLHSQGHPDQQDKDYDK